MSKLAKFFTKFFKAARQQAPDTAMFVPVDQYDLRPGPEPPRRKDAAGNPLLLQTVPPYLGMGRPF